MKSKNRPLEDVVTDKQKIGVTSAYGVESVAEEAIDRQNRDDRRRRIRAQSGATDALSGRPVTEARAGAGEKAPDVLSQIDQIAHRTLAARIDNRKRSAEVEIIGRQRGACVKTE